MNHEDQGTGFDSGARGYELQGRKTPRVFVVQQPAVFENGRARPTINVSPANEFGRLIFVCESGNIFADRLPAVIRHMKTVLRDFSDADYILAVGDPVAIAAVTMIASERTGGRVKMLKWDRHNTRYRSFQITIELESRP